jgi:glycosyltransferase involved in cell wall biosynthesis
VARPTISALIIARNEEASLPGCLDSLSGLADEIVVIVDAASTDQTEAIAQQRTPLVRVRTFDRFSSQRNAALEMASGIWVLSIDADERVTPALAAEIRSALLSDNQDHAGYRVPIRSIILGRRFLYSGTQLDRPLRLFRRDRGRWTGDVHETVELEGGIGTLKHHLEHRTIPDLKIFLSKINQYTDLESEQAFMKGRRPSSFDLWLRPFWTFAKLFILRRGVLDGKEGFLFCLLSGFSAFLREWKLRERWKQAPASPALPLALSGVGGRS